MQFRTDLAVETRELSGTGKLDGVIETEENKSGIKISKIEVTNDNGAKLLGKPIGTYITIDIPPLTDYSENERMDLIADELRAMLPKEGLILITGLGNLQITPDALGPKTASLIFATRHIQGEIARTAGLENLRPVAVLAPGVLGQTGMETGEIISSICKKISPSAIIVIDAMASRRVSRLGTTVQICDTGISPGSGVGNARPQLSYETLGIPVIAVGIPTVVDARTLAADLVSQTGADDKTIESLETSTEPHGTMMIVTPREIDLLINRASKLLSLSINTALHPELSPEDFEMLVS